MNAGLSTDGLFVPVLRCVDWDGEYAVPHRDGSFYFTPDFDDAYETAVLHWTDVDQWGNELPVRIIFADYEGDQDDQLMIDYADEIIDQVLA